MRGTKEQLEQLNLAVKRQQMRSNLSPYQAFCENGKLSDALQHESTAYQ